MMFRKSKVVVPHTVIRCRHCGPDSKRPYADGDYVCMELECPRCGRAAAVCGIFGEEREG